MAGWTKTKIMLFSTQVDVVVEVGVELGKKGYKYKIVEISFGFENAKKVPRI